MLTSAIHRATFTFIHAFIGSISLYVPFVSSQFVCYCSTVDRIVLFASYSYNLVISITQAEILRLIMIIR